MGSYAQLLVFLIIFIVVMAMCYISLQKVDFSKIFKFSSTKQILVLILFISMSIGFVIASGILKIFELILNCF